MAKVNESLVSNPYIEDLFKLINAISSTVPEGYTLVQTQEPDVILEGFLTRLQDDLVQLEAALALAEASQAELWEGIPRLDWIADLEDQIAQIEANISALEVEIANLSS